MSSPAINLSELFLSAYFHPNSILKFIHQYPLFSICKYWLIRMVPRNLDSVRSDLNSCKFPSYERILIKSFNKLLLFLSLLFSFFVELGSQSSCLTSYAISSTSSLSLVLAILRNIVILLIIAN